jgi:uncharacterized protein
MAKKSSPRKSTKKRAVAKRPARRAARKTSRAARKTSRASARKHTHTPGMEGWITHTELQSADPEATKAWAAKVLGWKFTQSMPMPGGEYHLFAYSDEGGGGIRQTVPGEAPGSSFTVHVSDAHEAYARALSEGAAPLRAPQRIMEGVTIAEVRAPGGVKVGISGP